MSMKLRLAALATALVALGACDRFGGTPIDMANPPHTKAGLWAEAGTFNGKPRAPSTFCDPGRAIFPPKDRNCSEWQAMRTGDGAIDFHAVCPDSGATIRMHRHITGDLASGFTDDITSDLDAPRNTISSHSVLRYVGPCPPGMKPINPTAG
jgi:hypothetical protein